MACPGAGRPVPSGDHLCQQEKYPSQGEQSLQCSVVGVLVSPQGGGAPQGLPALALFVPCCGYLALSPAAAPAQVELQYLHTLSPARSSSTA